MKPQQRTQLRAVRTLTPRPALTMGLALALGFAPLALAQPTITRQPADQFVDVGQTAVFNPAVSSATPSTNQWFFNGVALANATNRFLRFLNAQPSVNGAYFVVVGNDSGSVTSQVARLKVFVPAPHSIDTLQIQPGSSVALGLAGETTAAFAAHYDLYPLEVSSNLVDWAPLATLARTNADMNQSIFSDLEAAGVQRRFYRTPTNWYVTPFGQPTGPHAVGTFDRVLSDPSRTNRYGVITNSSFYVTFWYPAQRQAGQRPEALIPDKGVEVALARVINGWLTGAVIMTNFCVQVLKDCPVATNQTTYPLVIYSCGGNDFRQDNSGLALELASHGFVVVSADYEDNSRIRVPGGGIVTGNLPADSVLTYQSRFKDGQFLLDQLAEMNTTDPILSGHLDLQRIGVVGWSTGGVNGAQLCLQEPRVQAGVLLDPGYISYVPQLLTTGITKPFLVITGQLADGKTLFDRAPGPAYWLHISGSVHVNMGDLRLYLGASSDRRISEVRYAYALSALKKWLLNDDNHLLDGPSPLYPEVPAILSK